jgi:hypothetical protein
MCLKRIPNGKPSSGGIRTISGSYFVIADIGDVLLLEEDLTKAGMLLP